MILSIRNLFEMGDLLFMEDYRKASYHAHGSLMEQIPAAGSGGHRPGGDVHGNGESCWHWHTEYRNHNTGHHTEVAIIGVHTGHDSEPCSMTLDFHTDFAFGYVKDAGGDWIATNRPDGFTLTTNQWKKIVLCNPKDRIEFNIQIVTANHNCDAQGRALEGAIGKDNEGKCHIDIVGWREW